MKQVTVIVIGGGIAGSTAAYALAARGCAVTLLEQGDRLGGRIQTERIDGVTFDSGAQFFTNFYTNTMSLIERLGLNEKICPIRTDLAIMRAGMPRRLQSLATLFGTALLTQRAKLRLMAELARMLRYWRFLDLHDVSRAARLDDRSVAEHLAGLGGRDLVDYLFQPVLNGLLYWSPERTSRATLAVSFKAALSLRGMYTLRDGLTELVERAAEASTIRLGHEVGSVTENRSQCQVAVVSVDGESRLTADGVVCAVPATVVPRIVTNLTAAQEEFFSSIQYSATAVAAYGLRQPYYESIDAVLYPAVESPDIAAITTLARRQRGRPNVSEVVKIFASGAIGPMLCKEPDDTVAARLSLATNTTFDSSAGLMFRKVVRWPEALPEFETGHFHRLRSVEGEGLDSDRLVYAGDYLGGPFIEGAVTSGLRAAERLADRMGIS